ncbi:hypothetical protein HPB51_000354 [Rhipicephalus microplus]|uniref:Uncharacterized protein n=1 Tax=Rhipicephalus microplus TaxID=6941 RepID=A0A9J6DKN2_RHIMP|nr:hypothetical protein HPB51_000354 [Rhipicephalus microplus]
MMQLHRVVRSNYVLFEQGQASHQQQLLPEELSLLTTQSTPFTFSEGVRHAASSGRHRDVDSSTTRSSAALPRRANESADVQPARFLHMPKNLRESMSPQQRELYRDFQQEPGGFSPLYSIPREKMHDAEVRASLLVYVRSVIDEAVECVKVITACALGESQSRPNTLHKWDPKASVRNATEENVGHTEESLQAACSRSRSLRRVLRTPVYTKEIRICAS